MNILIIVVIPETRKWTLDLGCVMTTIGGTVVIYNGLNCVGCLLACLLALRAEPLCKCLVHFGLEVRVALGSVHIEAAHDHDQIMRQAPDLTADGCRLSNGLAVVAAVLINGLDLEVLLNALFKRGCLEIRKADLQHIEELIALANIIAARALHTNLHQTEEVVDNR